MKRILLILTSLFALGACDPNQERQPAQNFDRKAMLENMADNLIIPAFSELRQQTISLETAVKAFSANPNSSTLSAAQQAWEATYLAWLKATPYNFGPGELPVFGTLTENIGIFPVATTKIEANIQSGNMSFDNFERDSRGFLALDYLLFSAEGNDVVITKFSNANRGKYAVRVVEDIREKVNTVRTGWDSYRTTFINNSGTDAGSSTSMLYNEFIKSFEAAKNFKVQLPAGQRAGQTSAEPTRVEAFYSGKSIQFLEAHLKTIQHIWEGKSTSGQDGVGFEEYLSSVEGGKDLIAQTRTQLSAVQLAKGRVPAGRLSEAIKTNLSVVQDLGVELQKQTRFYKSDMASLLGIAITFNSGDGD